ncbi:MAG: hypothetical protein IJN32_04495, partial [Thermoguttaceae bacterium]|nr:hypothetical protein [Thermoguttaceae bacterium]
MQTPKSRRLRLENLEERALLSVTPNEYAALRDANPEICLPANQSEINIIELTELTNAALQKAADLAASTRQDDLIFVRTSAAASTINLEEGITVSLDAENCGSLTIAASKELPLNLSVAGLSGSALTVNSGVVVLANANFVDVDATNLDIYANLITVADGAAYKPNNISVFNMDGVDVSALDVREILANERSEARQEFADLQDRVDSNSSTAGTNGSTNASASANDYAILFYGGCDPLQNNDRYYYNLKELYEVLTVSYELPRENIFVLYAGGVEQNTYVSLGPDRNDPAANGLYSDLSFAKGSPVYSANSGNLYDACATVAGKMTDDSRLLFFSYDHGSGTSGDATNYNDYVCGWNENVGGSFVADALFQIDRGFVTTVHSQCYSGGILDDIHNPATGAVLD